jgi:hypothetical protein
MINMRNIVMENNKLTVNTQIIKKKNKLIKIIKKINM